MDGRIGDGCCRVRHGFSCQVPARRAVERDEEKVTGWVGEGDLAAGGRTAAALDAWILFEDESGFSMTPPIARIWARRGRTPVIRVRGGSSRRISIAAHQRHSGPIVLVWDNQRPSRRQDAAVHRRTGLAHMTTRVQAQ
ncbi:winged helix-turn-helix domain-containing protein [Streptomyces prunicolor]|nr:winged helix-turn-helix domain-containing protein [Streptomyces prunicolor]MCX5239865.1 winged helix-turn-helix domain-containing protein [Streptomyces prunicolor]